MKTTTTTITCDLCESITVYRKYVTFEIKVPISHEERDIHVCIKCLDSKELQSKFYESNYWTGNILKVFKRYLGAKKCKQA